MIRPRLVVAAAAVFAATACGAPAPPGELVPALRTQLTQVDQAIIAEDYTQARDDLDALAAQTATARDRAGSPPTKPTGYLPRSPASPRTSPSRPRPHRQRNLPHRASQPRTPLTAAAPRRAPTRPRKATREAAASKKATVRRTAGPGRRAKARRRAATRRRAIATGRVKTRRAQPTRTAVAPTTVATTDRSPSGETLGTPGNNSVLCPRSADQFGSGGDCRPRGGHGEVIDAHPLRRQRRPGTYADALPAAQLHALASLPGARGSSRIRRRSGESVRTGGEDQAAQSILGERSAGRRHVRRLDAVGRGRS